MSVVVRLLLICLPLTLAAQQPLQYTRLTAENGLSNNSVQCILQDRHGIVWIGTNGGLNRYDGSSFIQYSILSTPALTNSVVTTLMQDDDGYIWVGTENGLNVLNPATNIVRQYIHDNAIAGSLPQGPIRVIQKMSDGNTWVLSDKWMVKFRDRLSFSPVNIDSSLTQDAMVFTALAIPNPDEVWISYLDQVTTLAHRTTRNGQDYIEDAIYRTPDYGKIYTDANQTTWSISCNGISRYNNTTHSFENWLINNYAPRRPNLHLHTCYCTDADGNIWQGSDGASLVKFDMQRRKVTDYSWLLSGTHATLAYCIYRDNSNNIWIGTDNGIIKISNRTSVFGNIPFSLDGAELENIRCRRIIADKRHTLYAATENYGLLKMVQTRDGRDSTIRLSTFGATAISSLPFHNSVLHIPLKGHYDIGYIYDMWDAGNDIIWLAGFGIGRYNTRTDSLDIFLATGDVQTQTESINQFAICFDGQLFWTAGEHNLYNFDPRTQTMASFKDNKGGMPFHNLPCWSLVKKGSWIWAGTNRGLFKVNIYTHEVVKKTLHPTQEYVINDIHIDKDSSFWISTAGGGVIHYNDSTGFIKQYTNKEGLSNNTVCGILQDDNYNLWISTYAGLSYLDRSMDRFTCFYTRDGLNNDEFNRKAFSRLADGRMIFGGLNGYTIFDPSDAFKRDKQVNIILTKFTRTNGNGEAEETIFDQPSDRQVIIEPDDKFFAFHFTLTDMYDPPGNRYMYMLEGLDNAWHSIGNQNFVSFNGLPASRYTLRIRGNPGKGSSVVNDLVVNIRVKQVFYKTIWFMLLALAAAAVIVYAIVRYRINQVKKIQYLRTRIASDLHDEVGSSLTHITILADMVKRSGRSQEIDQQLTSIAGISREAVSTIKDIIWSVDARYDTMAGMISHMRDHIHSLLAPAEIEFEFTQKGLQEDEKLPLDFRQNVYLIFKEAINNIVKHSKAATVRIALEKDHNTFTMIIKDNGKGFDKTEPGSGQGLSNMRMRAVRLGATIRIVSQNGVLVSLQVPV